MSDKKQSKQFIDKAREIESDESGKLFDRVFKKIVSPASKSISVKKKHGKKRSL